MMACVDSRRFDNNRIDSNRIDSNRFDNNGSKRVAWTTEDEIAWNLTNPFRQFLGVEIEWVDGSRAEVSLSTTENLLQAYGMVHGGIYCVLIDTVLGTAVRGAYQGDAKPLTTDLNVSFLRPARLGTLYASAEIIKAGGKIAVGTGEVRDEEGRQLALGRGSFMVDPGAIRR